MKKIFFTSSIILIFLLVSLMLVLSTIGFETDRFNKFISDKITENNKDTSLKLEKIKFKFDIRDINLFLETNNPKLIYKDSKIPVDNVKAYLDFISLVESNPKIDKINISSKEINVDQLKNIIIKTKPSNLNSLVINKIKNGKLLINLEMYFKENLNFGDFILKGEVKETDIIITNDLNLTNVSFNFFADSSDILIKNISSKTQGILIKNGNLSIKRNDEINIQSDFSTEIKIDKRNIVKYLPFFENIKFVNEEAIISANLDNFLDITFDKTFKVTNYVYTNKGKVNELFFKFDKSVKNSFLKETLTMQYKYLNISFNFTITNQTNKKIRKININTKNKKFFFNLNIPLNQKKINSFLNLYKTLDKKNISGDEFGLSFHKEIYKEKIKIIEKLKNI